MNNVIHLVLWAFEHAHKDLDKAVRDSIICHFFYRSCTFSIKNVINGWVFVADKLSNIIIMAFYPNYNIFLYQVSFM